jgi:hypothetical protein
MLPKQHFTALRHPPLVESRLRQSRGMYQSSRGTPITVSAASSSCSTQRRQAELRHTAIVTATTLYTVTAASSVAASSTTTHTAADRRVQLLRRQRRLRSYHLHTRPRLLAPPPHTASQVQLHARAGHQRQREPRIRRRVHHRRRRVLHALAHSTRPSVRRCSPAVVASDNVAHETSAARHHRDHQRGLAVAVLRLHCRITAVQ